ncbi:hypothetical protein MUP77_04765 [Candidatus Bathyarchaeota archaeon]|nr:hypothetical protein [Candidatus Bathyarchaeota archaeon]
MTHTKWQVFALPAILLAIALMLVNLLPPASSIANRELLVSILGSLLGVSATITTLIGIFISLAIERVREARTLILEILDEMQKIQWAMLAPEESQKTFDSMRRLYGVRYKQMYVPKAYKKTFFLVYYSGMAMTIVILSLMGYVLDIDEIGMLGALVFVAASGLAIVPLIALGYLILDLLSPRRGWMFVANEPQSLDNLGDLASALALDYRVVISKFGLIRVQAVLAEPSKYYLLIRSAFKDLGSNYDIVFETMKKNYRMSGSLIEDKIATVLVKKKDFPPIFQRTVSWRLHINLHGPFPRGFCTGEHGKLLFKEIRYIFKEVSRVRNVGIPTDLKLIEVAYVKPEENIDNLILRERWTTIFRSFDKPD